MRISFCGLGQMGGPMAARLVDAGHDVTVWNRTPARTEPLVARGAVAAATPAEAAAGTEVAVTMLADPASLQEVVSGPRGLGHALGEGSVLVDMSTVGPAAVFAMMSHLRAGVDVLDAPVLGSVPQATDGSLAIFVGGDPEVVERCRPVLAAMGRPVHLGPLGAGAAMKLVANSTLGALMCALAEALALADALGLAEADVLEVLSQSPIGPTTRSKRALVEGGEYRPPNFKLALAAKDLSLVVEAATEAGVDLRLAPAARSWFEQSKSAGLGDLDYSAVVAQARGRPPRPAIG